MIHSISIPASFMLHHTLIPVVANLCALLFSRLLLAPLLGLDLKIPADVSFCKHLIHFIFADVMAFALPLLLSWRYLLPSFRYLSKKNCSHEKARRRALNSPIIISLISALGWILSVSGITLELLMPHEFQFNLSEPSTKTIYKIVFSGFFTAFTALAVSFYILEWLNRRKFVRHFFPDGQISHYKKIFKLSIRTRFLIYFFVVGMYPILLLRSGAARLKSLLPEDFLHRNAFDSTFQAEMIIGAGFIFLGIFLTFIMARYYQRPLETLEKASREIRKGNYKVRVPVLSADEIGYLSESFNYTSKQLSGLVSTLTETNLTLEKKVEERTRELEEERNRLKMRNLQIENEIKLARQIQKNLIPAFPPLKNMASLYEPMDVVGGDFYDFVVFRENQNIGIFLSDVSGHGIPAAFITSMLKSFLLQAGSLKQDPQKLLQYLNQGLYGQTAGNFVTAFYGIYHPETRKLIYASAAHNAPYLITEHKVEEIPSPFRGLPLAAFDNHFLENRDSFYANHEILLPEKSKLLFYTDGLTEATPLMSSDVTQTFEDDILAVLNQYAQQRPEELIQGLFQSLVQFRQSKSFEDDICLICLEIT